MTEAEPTLADLSPIAASSPELSTTAEKATVVLTVDIWYLTFQMLKEKISSQRFLQSEFRVWLQALRLLSRDFNQAITLIVYSGVNLWNGVTISGLVEDFSPAALRIKANMKTYTTAMHIPNTGDLVARTTAVALINHCNRLDYLA